MKIKHNVFKILAIGLIVSVNCSLMAMDDAPQEVSTEELSAKFFTIFQLAINLNNIDVADVANVKKYKLLMLQEAKTFLLQCLQKKDIPVHMQQGLSLILEGVQVVEQGGLQQNQDLQQQGKQLILEGIKVIKQDQQQNQAVFAEEIQSE